jgi:hypothetical protein|mmetsp:Transcript_41210/g.66801  ORF Transcript_41210/g.66801 Transcript_41210/m.66801 type:complete len:107 (+) Transcript_41210:256-576(+)
MYPHILGKRIFKYSSGLAKHIQQNASPQEDWSAVWLESRNVLEPPCLPACEEGIQRCIEGKKPEDAKLMQPSQLEKVSPIRQPSIGCAHANLGHIPQKTGKLEKYI